MREIQNFPNLPQISTKPPVKLEMHTKHKASNFEYTWRQHNVGLRNSLNRIFLKIMFTWEMSKSGVLQIFPDLEISSDSSFPVPSFMLHLIP